MTLKEGIAILARSGSFTDRGTKFFGALTSAFTTAPEVNQVFYGSISSAVPMAVVLYNTNAQRLEAVTLSVQELAQVRLCVGVLAVNGEPAPCHLFVGQLFQLSSPWPNIGVAY